MSDQARLAHKTHVVKISKSSCPNFTVSYFAFWSWVAKIVKIWTSRKFPAIRYWPIPGLISYAEVTGKWGLLSLNYMYYMSMHTSNVPEDIQWFEGSVQLRQLLQLQFLEVIVVARDVNPTLNDCLDLSKPEEDTLQL